MIFTAYKYFRPGANDNVCEVDPYGLDDMPQQPSNHYEASGEEETEDEVGYFDMQIENEPCWANRFEGYGEGCAIPNSSNYLTTEFCLRACKEAFKNPNIPTKLPRGRVDGYCFITRSEPKYTITGGKKVLRTDDLCDRHGAYASNKTNTSRDVYVLKPETDKFHVDKTLVFDLDEDVIYRREDLKDGVQPIRNKDVRYKQYDYCLQFDLIKISLLPFTNCRKDC